MHESAFAAVGARWLVCLGVTIGAAMTAVGCASVIEGRSQHISVNTNPTGARCGFYREEGMRIATIERTPGNALVEKTKADIWIVCVKSGYQRASFRNHSGVSGAAFVNVIGGVFTLGISTAIGAAVDSSNGSDNKYESPVNMTMVANAPDQPAGSSALPETFNIGAGGQTGQQQPALPDTQATAAETDDKPVSLVAATSARSAGTLPAAGIWECGIKGGSRHYKLQFVVSADRSIIVTSYANARATIQRNDPLTFSAVHPPSSRTIDFVWKTDNTMSLSGPSANNLGGTFHDAGACAKV